MRHATQAGGGHGPQELTTSELPPGLAEMAFPPDIAYLWGRLPPPPWVSIVGTRSPSSEGLRAAFLLARKLARTGVTVVSGGAIGIDTAAHLGALAGRGPTLVVAPTWFDTAYPKVNHRLFSTILGKGGGYLTVSPASARPLPHIFFHRNEALVALSHAVVLGECPHKSGAKNAMLHARALRRPRFALPFFFDRDAGRGTWEEVVIQGAEILVDERPVLQMLQEYGPFENSRYWDYLCSRLRSTEQLGFSGFGSPAARPRRVSRAKASSPSSSAEEKARASSLQALNTKGANGSSEKVPENQIIEAVLAGHRTTEQICSATGLLPESVQHEILLLLIDGCLSEDATGLLRYHSRPHE